MHAIPRNEWHKCTMLVSFSFKRLKPENSLFPQDSDDTSLQWDNTLIQHEGMHVQNTLRTKSYSFLKPEIQSNVICEWIGTKVNSISHKQLMEEHPLSNA